VRYGPLVFLAALFAMASSWMGFVLVPQLQLGSLQQTNTVPAGATYPLGRPGLARQGLAVYRANGCAACHTQQIGQTGTTCDVVLAEPGTNQAALLSALSALPAGPSEAEARRLLTELPKTVLTATNKEDADAVAKDLSVGGAKAQVWIVPQGPDIARGWGKRRTVAEDFLYDYPVMLGSQRIGPDLADIGARRPDPNWQLRHLYSPQLEVPGSMMPPYRFLFETRRIDRVPSPDALALPASLAPAPGYEIVPKAQAKALVAYLASLQANAPLFDAPLSVAEAAATNAPAGSTNALAGAATNSPAQ
jgi:cbb3-type cytochrome oxidase cytochrome c subunit